jgi:hypothetical protein
MSDSSVPNDEASANVSEVSTKVSAELDQQYINQMRVQFQALNEHLVHHMYQMFELACVCEYRALVWHMPFASIAHQPFENIAQVLVPLSSFTEFSTSIALNSPIPESTSSQDDELCRQAWIRFIAQLCMQPHPSCLVIQEVLVHILKLKLFPSVHHVFRDLLLFLSPLQRSVLFTELITKSCLQCWASYNPFRSQ